jgi:8-oxo-dGTP pyrophosphatase MutT (NUDIX family)
MKKKDETLIKKCDQHWQLLRSEYIYQCPWLSLRKDVVQTTKGIVTPDFYVLEYPTWVNVIAKTVEGKYLIERQYRHGIQKCVCELCAGMCEPGEQPIDAAKRELLEETGYSGGSWSLIGEYAPNPSAMTNCSYTFLAEGVVLHKSPCPEITEDIQVFEVTEEELLAVMQEREMIEGVMLAPLWQYFYNKKKKKHK